MWFWEAKNGMTTQLLLLTEFIVVRKAAHDSPSHLSITRNSNTFNILIFYISAKRSRALLTLLTTENITRNAYVILSFYTPAWGNSLSRKGQMLKVGVVRGFNFPKLRECSLSTQQRIKVCDRRWAFSSLWARETEVVYATIDEIRPHYIRAGVIDQAPQDSLLVLRAVLIYRKIKQMLIVTREKKRPEEAIGLVLRA